MAYRLSFDEQVPRSLRRCVREELATASSLLRDDFDADPVEAIHEARKSLKKARALLRLVRPGLPKRVYRSENRALRDAGRQISGARDADVMVATVEDLAERYSGRVPADHLDGLLEYLREESRTARATTAAGAGRAQAVGLVDAVAGRIDDWPLRRCDWTTVAAGMERAYRAGRLAFVEADEDPTVARLHDWRKRVKDVWYHQRLVCPAWPDVLGAQAHAAHQLSEILGDDHDLAVLAGLLGGEAGPRPPVPIDPDPLLALVAERRAELLADARHLGGLVYAERPNAFARRIRRYLEGARAQAADPSGSEIERKFLVDERPDDLGDHPSESIEQGYIAVEGPVEVRVRRRAGVSLLTVKSGAGRVRLEEEFEIDARRLTSLWPLSDGRRVAKTRHRIPYPGGLTIELDVYGGPLDGLMVAEVEFESEAASDRFEPPSWFGREITDDLRYANRALAVGGVPDGQ